MIKDRIDNAIDALEHRMAITQRLINDLTERHTAKQNALSLLRQVREDMDQDPDRADALEWLLDSLKIADVIR